MIDLNKARTFVEVVKAGTVTQAAKNLFRTQQAISHQLKVLEKELGLILFDRSAAKILLTEDGQQLYQAFQQSITLADNAVAELKQNKTQAQGTIRLGVWQEQVYTYLPELLGEFCTLYPQIKFEIFIGSDFELEVKLMDNELDFAIVVSVGNKNLLAAIPVFSRNMVPVASKQYLKDHGPINTLDDLLDKKLIDYPQGYAAFPVYFKKNCQGNYAEFAKKQAHITIKNDIGHLKFALKGLGVAIIFEDLLEDPVNASQLTRLLPNSEFLTATVDLAYKKRQVLGFIQNEFLQFTSSRPLTCY